MQEKRVRIPAVAVEITLRCEEDEVLVAKALKVHETLVEVFPGRRERLREPFEVNSRMIALQNLRTGSQDAEVISFRINLDQAYVAVLVREGIRCRV